MAEAYFYACSSREEPDYYAFDFDPNAPTPECELDGKPAGTISLYLPWDDYCDALKHLGKRVRLTITPTTEEETPA